MLKVLLMIDCELCRRLFSLSHFASADPSAWLVHGDNLAASAEHQGWQRSLCGNFHYCPDCCAELEQQERHLGQQLL